MNIRRSLALVTEVLHVQRRRGKKEEENDSSEEMIRI